MQTDENLKIEGGIIKIIAGDKVKTLYGEYRTLKECLDLAKTISDVPMPCVIVMHEEAMRGNIYRYGNNGAFWEHIGTTIGFVK